MRKVAAWIAPVLGLWIVACSSGSSGGASVSADQSCTDVGNTICQKFDSCSAFFVQDTYGDTATCSARIELSCANQLAASGTGLTPALYETCAQSLSSATCADVLGNNFPSACRAAAGQLATGTTCGDSSQCKSTYCNLGTDGTCGACGASRASAGSKCNQTDDCNYGLVCPEGVCTAPVAAGGTCDDTHPCQSALVCKNGVCATPDEAGMACTEASCDQLAGLYCPGGANAVCTKIAFATAGQPCGVINGGFTACSAGGHCKASGTGTGTGTCQAPAADGAACDDTAGPTCLPPAVCGATSKVCTVADPATCQ